jgi:xanthine dehydrogenase molybdopterin-binding subunit B
VAGRPAQGQGEFAYSSDLWFAVLTHEDVPGAKTYGMKVADQPVLAYDVVPFQGEPVAIVAADHPETAPPRGAPDRRGLRAARAGHRS